MAGRMPAFTLMVLNLSEAFRSHFLAVGAGVLASGGGVASFHSHPARAGGCLTASNWSRPWPAKLSGRWCSHDLPGTLGTLLGSGVPILQALTIVKETAGNVIVGDVIAKVHDSVKEGGTVTVPLKESRIFPAMVSGMVDVGEQAGALPDMLMKIADTCDEEVDNAVSAMTSLLEPVMIVFLAVVVGSIVIAMFLPILMAIGGGPGVGGGGAGGGI